MLVSNSNSLKDDMKPNFQKFLTRKHAVLTDDILVSAWNDEGRFKKLTGLNEYVQNLEIIDGDFYFDKNWMDGISARYKNKDPQFFQGFIKKGIMHGEKLKKFARNLKIENKKPEDLKKDFWRSVELLKNLLVFLPETHPLAKVIENKSIEILKNKGINNNKIQDILLEISYPRKYNSPVLEQIDLLKIKTKFKKDRAFNLDLALQRHAKRYSFLGYREPFSHGYPISFFKNRVIEPLSGNNKYGASGKQEIRFSAAEKKMINIMRDFVYFRNYRTEKLYESLYYLEPLWTTLGAQCGLNAGSDFGYLLLGDAEKLLSKKTKISGATIKKRRAGYGVLLHNDKMWLIIGDALRKKKAATSEIKESVKEIRGMVACRGRAKGIVKIIAKASEQSKINNGDILVAPMTTPDLMPSMKKAAAFITDEGGITCHAAIVAREMNKPCIIGTKVATKALKDGDFIEVDANQGIVRILKK